MEESEIRTVTEIPIPTTNSSFGNRRRRPLRSRTVDTLHRILSMCNVDPFQTIQNSEQTSMDETRVVLDAQEDGSYGKRVESAEHDHNILGEKKDISQKVNSSSLVNAKGQDNHDMICSSPHLLTTEDVEEGEISGGFTGTKTGLRNDSKRNNVNIASLFTETAENGGADVARVINKTTRNLVDYSEITAHAKSQQSVKQATLKVNATKNQDQVKDNVAQNNRKRQRSCTEEERSNKKSKESVDPTTCPENVAEVVDASTNKDACDEKRKKRVLTKERKAKKKRNDRIKRAEKNRKLGIKRLKLQPVIKEKKITYCRHYMNGRCHEGEKCKFSHDTTPLTKSKPCCHFARHGCMKGDACPYDHELSKYPCSNYQTQGSCNRGSDCMFSHETQPSEDSLNESNKSKPGQKPPSNSGSKSPETKSCLVPKFVDITPKGINFFSQEKLPLESRLSPKVDSKVKEITKTPTVVPRGMNFLSFGKKPTLESSSSSKVDSEVKDITKMPPPVQDSEVKTKDPSVVHDSEEITKTPTVVPRGVNFLSFGKKPGLDYSNCGHLFRFSNRREKPRISDVVADGLRSDPVVNMVNEVKVDFSADKPSSSKKPIPMMSFMSSTLQKSLRSTLAFASELDSGVKSKV